MKFTTIILLFLVLLNINGIYSLIDGSGSSSGATLPSTYDVIGPFPVGEREDGLDALEAYGGIFEIPIGDATLYPSELGASGHVGWLSVSSATPGTFSYDYSDQVDWPFFQVVWGWAIWLWYGYAVGELTIAKAGQYVVDCTGIRTYYIRSTDDSGVFYELAGDFYSYGTGQQVVSLEEGTYQIVFKLQSSVRLNQSPACNFQCSIQYVGEDQGIMVIPSESMIADIVGGQLASPYASVTFINTGLTPIENVSVSLLDNSLFDQILYSRSLDGVSDIVTILPGQKLSVPFALRSLPGVTYDCPMSLPLLINAKGVALQNTTVPLNCTAWGNPFVFTFIDYDQTVQYAVATPPSTECGNLPFQCNIMLALHGAGVEASSTFWFTALPQQETLWTVFPTGRRSWGYDWEGPSRRNAFMAVNYLQANLPGVPSSLKSLYSIDVGRILVVGHSMGGHGCWATITHFGDLVMGAACAAGFVKIQHYVFYNTRPGFAYVDPSLQGILMAAIAENDLDLHSSNLVGLPILARYGQNDTNVNPWHSRRMARMVAEQSNNVSAVIVSEVPNENHWFTGILDDPFMVNYYAYVMAQNTNYLPPIPKSIIITCHNPAVEGQRANIQIYQLVVPGRVGRIRLTQISQQGSLTWVLNTQNVQRFYLSTTPPREEGLPDTIIVDGEQFPAKFPPFHYYREDKYAIQSWNITDDETWMGYEKSPYTYGPIRQIFEKPFTIIYGTNASDSTVDTMQWAATYIANFWQTNGRGSALIIQDTDFVPPETCSPNTNYILIGNTYQNLVSSKYSAQMSISFDPDNSFYAGPGYYSSPSIGTAFIAPNECGQGLLLVVAGVDDDGLIKVLHALPQISAITVPDFIVVGEEYGWKGAGGILQAGFWDNDWTYQPQCAYLGLQSFD